MRFLIIIYILLSFHSFGQSEKYIALLKKYYTDFPTISLEETNKKLNQANIYFLDTRKKEEFDISHLKNAKWVGYDEFNLNSVIKHIPLTAEIIVYCSIGARSQNIGEQLKKVGYRNVKNLYGGLFNWANHNYPMYDNLGNQTDQIHGYSKDWGKWINNQKKVVY